MEEGGEWEYPEKVGGMGIDGDGKIIDCSDGEPSDDGVDGLECEVSDDTERDGLTIEDNVFTYDEPDTDMAGSATWEKQMEAFEESNDVTLADYNTIYFKCSLYLGDSFDASCSSGPKLVKKDHQGDEDAELCFAQALQALMVGLIMSVSF